MGFIQEFLQYRPLEPNLLPRMRKRKADPPWSMSVTQKRSPMFLHLIDGDLELQNLSGCLHFNLPGEITSCDSCCDFNISITLRWHQEGYLVQYFEPGR